MLVHDFEFHMNLPQSQQFCFGMNIYFFQEITCIYESLTAYQKGACSSCHQPGLYQDPLDTWFLLAN